MDSLSLTFFALADPTRRAILARLSKGEANVSELAEPFKMSLPAISKHLQVLRKAGLITQGRNAQWRPCRIEPAPLRDVSAWMEQYREILDARYDRLSEVLREIQQQDPPQAESHDTNE